MVGIRNRSASSSHVTLTDELRNDLYKAIPR